MDEIETKQVHTVGGKQFDDFGEAEDHARALGFQRVAERYADSIDETAVEDEAPMMGKMMSKKYRTLLINRTVTFLTWQWADAQADADAED